MEDEFKTTSFNENQVISGNYDNRFNIIDVISGENIEYKLSFDQKLRNKPINLLQQKSSFRCGFNH